MPFIVPPKVPIIKGLPSKRTLAKLAKTAPYRKASFDRDVRQLALCLLIKSGADESNYRRTLAAFYVDAEARKVYQDSLPRNPRYLLEKQAAGSYTFDEWRAHCAKYNYRCLRCERDDVPLTVDHVIPLSRGGSHNIENLQALCRSCNSSKGVKSTDYRR